MPGGEGETLLTKRYSNEKGRWALEFIFGSEIRGRNDEIFRFPFDMFHLEHLSGKNSRLDRGLFRARGQV